VACGLTLFAAGVGLMRLARGPDRARDQASKGRVQVGRRTLSTLLLVVSIVLVYMGASGLIFALGTFFAHHSDPDVVFQVALGIPYLAIGLGGMQAARYLRRR
jgi:multisubunit Na+/H+ antiporter MnhB subunit